MQFRLIYTALFIAIFSLIIPFKTLATGSHFNEVDLSEGAYFEDVNLGFKIVLPEGLTKPADVYLFEGSSDSLSQLNVLGPVLTYYVYSEEVDETTEFKITLTYQGNNSGAKTVYYYNSDDNMWRMASGRAFLNNLTFTIKGKSNKLVIVGTKSLALESDQSSTSGEKNKVSETYHIDITNPDENKYSLKEICQPYLTEKMSASNNDPEAVKKLQTFLREEEGFSDLPSTGYFGNLTHNAVVAFQEKYRSSILDPWEIKKGTGLVYQTTLDKINELYCQKPEAKKYQLTFNYELPSDTAKVAYYLNETGEWQALESYNNHKTQEVYVITNLKELAMALFEEPQQWVGEASWYAYKGGYFAASRDFSKGTQLRVTNQSSGENQGKSIVVTINDYGPELWTGRIIDLDKVAFDALGSLSSGVMPVKIEVVK